MAISKDDLLAKLKEWSIEHATVEHAMSPTCEVHSANLTGTVFEKFIATGQAKNLFFKVPSGGGKLKNRLVMVCALVKTVTDNKQISNRLGVKASAPLRLAADDVYHKVLQVPVGAATPFAMAQGSTSEVTLLLDQNFKACETLLFHPMQSDHTTGIAPGQLEAFLEKCCPGRFAYVDFRSSEEIALPGEGGEAAKPEPKGPAPKAQPKAKAKAEAKAAEPAAGAAEAPEKAKKEQDFAPASMFTNVSWEESPFIQSHKDWLTRQAAKSA